MRFLATAPIILAILLASGCSRARVTTDLRADGTYTRTVALTGQEKKAGGMQMGSMEESFVLPSGKDWKSSEAKKDEDRTVTFVRAVAAGQVVKGDLSLREGEGDQLLLVNSVSITRLGPHRFEYKETLHWAGSPPKGANHMSPADLEEIKASLPGPLATDDNALALGKRAGELALPLLFGPGDPLLAISLLHPDLAERRASQRIGSVLLQALEQQFGDKLTPLQRREIARKLIAKAFSSNKPAQPDPSAGPPSKGGSGFIPLMFVLKTPGRIASSNGEVDELTGEVYWALFSEAASMKDLVLTAVCEFAQK